MFGLTTTELMVQDRLGDCLTTTMESAAMSGGSIAAIVVTTLVVIIGVCVGIFCYMRKQEQARQRAFTRSKARRTGATTASHANPTFTMADAVPAYEEIAADDVAAAATDVTYGSDTLYDGARQVDPPISTLYVEPTPLPIFRNADGVVYATCADDQADASSANNYENSDV